MQVKFKRPWFAPTQPDHVDKLRVFSGKRYRQGVHTVPDALAKFLPSDAEIIEGTSTGDVEIEAGASGKDVREKFESLEGRQQAELQRLKDEAAEQAKANRAASAAKAREALKAKREADAAKVKAGE